MSANNQLIILRGKDKELPIEVHENMCVDNDFYPSKANLLGSFKTLEEAIRFSNKYMFEEYVEYGYHISDSCLE